MPFFLIIHFLYSIVSSSYHTTSISIFKTFVLLNVSSSTYDWGLIVHKSSSCSYTMNSPSLFQFSVRPWNDWKPVSVTTASSWSPNSNSISSSYTSRSGTTKLFLNPPHAFIPSVIHAFFQTISLISLTHSLDANGQSTPTFSYFS